VRTDHNVAPRENAESKRAVVRPIFTAGHSNGSLERLVDLLRTHRIGTVVDVRSIPYSHYLPQFNSDELARQLYDARLNYLHMGDTLGGRPSQRACYDGAGHVIYERLESTSPYKMGIQEVLTHTDRGERVCLLCSEENPLKCHRFLSIGHVLMGLGRLVLHIRGSGAVEEQEELEVALFVSRPHQYTLFEEAPQRKSIQPVSPAREQSSSLKR
jgi:uncharacterized protein (DUF488 family)